MDLPCLDRGFCLQSTRFITTLFSLLLILKIKKQKTKFFLQNLLQNQKECGIMHCNVKNYVKIYEV